MASSESDSEVHGSVSASQLVKLGKSRGAGSSSTVGAGDEAAGGSSERVEIGGPDIFSYPNGDPVLCTSSLICWQHNYED